MSRPRPAMALIARDVADTAADFMPDLIPETTHSFH
jgi:hypothetical protein